MINPADDGFEPMAHKPEPRTPVNGHLPAHLGEVCALLAAGLLRLRSRAAEDLARDAALQARDLGESSLHLPPGQSGHATPKRRPA